MELRDRVLEAARVAHGRGEKPSLTELAALVGASRASVYRAVGSQAALLSELDVEPDPNARERVLAAAVDLIGRHGLSALSMDELAAAAQLSRASLYRLFPGKPALFKELVRVYSPVEVVAETIERLEGEPPDVVMPEVARNVVRALQDRVGLVRSLVLEITAGSPDTSEAIEYSAGRGLRAIALYVVTQMAAGRLRQVSPMLALQSFAGPIVLHLLTRELIQRRVDLDLPLDQAATELAEGWLRAMRPDAAGGEM
jgi:AcrR family transcriptional regulator